MRNIILFCLCFCAVACQSREIGSSSVESRKLVFSEDFAQPQLDKTWKRGAGEAGSGKWEVVDGWLIGSQLKNDPLWLMRPLPEKVRIEFDAESLTAEGDLKFEVFGDGERHASGYIVIFGGWNNTLDVIARLDEHGKDRLAVPSKKVKPNQVYKMAVERIDSELRWFVDGDLVMAYPDPKRLEGRNHQFFAFSNWTAKVRFDNLRIYELP